MKIKRNIAAIAILALSPMANAQRPHGCKGAAGSWIYTVPMEDAPTVHGVES
jgi:hypothetical protein